MTIFLRNFSDRVEITDLSIYEEQDLYKELEMGLIAFSKLGFLRSLQSMG